VVPSSLLQRLEDGKRGDILLRAEPRREPLPSSLNMAVRTAKPFPNEGMLCIYIHYTTFPEFVK